MLFMAAALCAVEVCLLEFHRESRSTADKKWREMITKIGVNRYFLILFCLLNIEDNLFEEKCIIISYLPGLMGAGLSGAPNTN